MIHKSKAIIWPVFLIAFFWPCQITEADKMLPESIPAAIECLRKFMGDNFVPKSFKIKDRPQLLPGEYLQEFCREENVKIINDRVLKDAKGHGLEVRECLRALKKEHIYVKYFETGDQQIKDAIEREEREEKAKIAQSGAPIEPSPKDDEDELEEGEIDDDDDEDVIGDKDDGKKGKPTEGQTTSPQYSPIRPSSDAKPLVPPAPPTMVRDESNAPKISQPSASEDQKQTVVQVDASMQDQSENLPGNERIPLSKIFFTDLTKFALGLCFDVPKFEFEQLQDKDEIKETFDCLEVCGTSFFDKIKYILSDARNKILRDLKTQYNQLVDKPSEKDGEGKKPDETGTTIKPADKSPEKQVDQSYSINSAKKRNIDKIFGNILSDQNKSTLPEIKEKIDVKQFRQIIEYFESNIWFDEEKGAFKQALVENIAKTLQDKRAKSVTPVEELDIKDIDMLTTTGIEFIKRYSEFYGEMDGFIEEDDVSPDEKLPLLPAGQNQPTNDNAKPVEKKETINGRLHNSLFFYKGCARRQCFMDSKESIPLDVFIEDLAKDPDQDTQAVDDDTQNDLDDDTPTALDDDTPTALDDDITPDTGTEILDKDTSLDTDAEAQQLKDKELDDMRKFAKVLTEEDPDDPDGSSESDGDDD